VEYILVKCDYFDKIGGNCTFFYDTDWVDFLSTSGIDYITAVIIILMVSAIFSDEYVSKSRVSVLTCFKGRTHTAICKLCVAFVFGFAISVCMSGVKYIGFAVQGVQSAENGGMCVRNLIGFGEFSGLTLAQYYLCNALFHSVIWAVCAVFICLVSNLVRSGIFTVFISFVAIVCTALLKTDSVTAFDFIFSGRLLTLNILDVSSTHSMAVILCVSVIKTAVYGIFSVRAWGISRK
jgi:hypothetical protein